MDGQRLLHNFCDPNARIQRRERILKNHLHLAARGAKFSRAEFEKVAAFEMDFAALLLALCTARFNARPGRRAVSCGTVPGIGVSLPRSSFEEAASKPCVYGWRGVASTSCVAVFLGTAALRSASSILF
jgi:hypothetical protein